MGKKRMSTRIDDKEKMVVSTSSSPSRFTKKSMAKLIADIQARSMSSPSENVADKQDVQSHVHKEKTIAEYLIEKKRVSDASMPKTKKQNVNKPLKPLKDLSSKPTEPVQHVQFSTPSKSDKVKKCGVESYPLSKQTDISKKKQKVEKTSKKDMKSTRKVDQKLGVKSSNIKFVRIRTTPKTFFTVLNCLKDG